MSRFAFCKIVSPLEEDEIEDLKGYGFFDWKAHGKVG